MYLRSALLPAALLSMFCGSPGKTTAPTIEAAARPVPVLSVQVSARDVPIYLEGIGSVAAWKTVNVRAQVEGKLTGVLFRDGQSVKRGQVLAVLDARPFSVQLSQAWGALVRDNALLTNHRLTLRRFQTLLAQNHIAQQVFDDEKALVGQYEGTVAVDQAQLATAKLNLSYTRIVAPIDGVVGMRLVDEGNLVRPDDATGIALITQLDPIAVFFTLPEDDRPRVAARMHEGPVSVQLYNRQGGTLLGTGTLLAIDNQSSEATAMVRLKVVLPNSQSALWPNQFVTARLLLHVRKQALVVPAVAVQQGPKGTFAYVVQKGDTAIVRPIKVELQIADQALIATGLAAGEEVVIEGQNQLKPGAKVAVKRLEAPAAGSSAAKTTRGAGTQP